MTSHKELTLLCDRLWGQLYTLQTKSAASIPAIQLNGQDFSKIGVSLVFEITLRLPDGALFAGFSDCAGAEQTTADLCEMAKSTILRKIWGTLAVLPPSMTLKEREFPTTVFVHPLFAAELRYFNVRENPNTLFHQIVGAKMPLALNALSALQNYRSLFVGRMTRAVATEMLLLECQRKIIQAEVDAQTRIFAHSEPRRLFVVLLKDRHVVEHASVCCQIKVATSIQEMLTVVSETPSAHRRRP
jgi:hypothetical protein